MRTSVRVAWRAAAAVAFAGTAALAITLTRGAPLHASLISARTATASPNTASPNASPNAASPNTASPTSSSASHSVGSLPACASSRLVVSIADAGGSTARVVASRGHMYMAMTRFPVEFTNVSDAACTLSGYPQVSAYRAGGAQVGNAAVLDASVTTRRIVLTPGATAHAAVVDSVPAARCRPVTATGLRVVPPGQSVARFVRHAVTACSAIGHEAPVFLRVWAVQAGTGVVIAPRDRPAAAPAN